MAVVVLEKVSDCSQASSLVPVGHLPPDRWLTSSLVLKGCSSNNDVRCLLRSHCSWIHFCRCWSGWKGRTAVSIRQSKGSSWWWNGPGRAAGRLCRCAPESGPTSAGSWQTEVAVLWRPATTTLAWRDYINALILLFMKVISAAARPLMNSYGLLVLNSRNLTWAMGSLWKEEDQPPVSLHDKVVKYFQMRLAQKNSWSVIFRNMLGRMWFWIYDENHIFFWKSTSSGGSGSLRVLHF